MKGKPMALISFRFDKNEARMFERKIEELIEYGHADSKNKAVELLLNSIIKGNIKKDKVKQIEYKRYAYRCDYEIYSKVIEKCNELEMSLIDAIRKII